MLRGNALLAICSAGAFAQTPDWQSAAGGKMSFEVASVRQSKGPFTPPNFPLDIGDAYRPVGGRFSADFPLTVYIAFAYKIAQTSEQRQAMIAALPKWVATDRFSIQAKAEGNPTKDQMRLMIQSLLADRFKLAVHFEDRETPFLALLQAKPGKLGPKLLPHDAGPPCDATAPADVFPPVCDVEELSARKGQYRAGSRHTTLESMVASLQAMGRLGRPLVDRTGLTGRFDFTLEWSPEPGEPLMAPGGAAPDPQGPTFLEALRDQLGFKLEAGRGPLPTLVVDRVDRPSEN